MDMALAKELIKQYNMLNKVKNQKFGYSSIYLMVDDMKNMKSVKEVLEEKGFRVLPMMKNLNIQKR